MQHDRRRTQAVSRATAAVGSAQGRRLAGALLVAASLAAGTALAQEGKALFEAKCSVCHTIGGGPKVGPDLKVAFAKRGKDGTVAAVLDPAKAGLKPSMPNLGLAKKEAEALAAYLESASAGAPAASAPAQPAPEAAAAEVHPEQVQLGQDLFEGKVRLAGGGPSCNACHDVKSDKVANGGILAAELTLAFSRMGKQGLQSVLQNTPFPAMQAAYSGKDLTDKEIAALVAFLQHVEKEHTGQMPREIGLRMASAGVGGVIVLIGVLSLAGRRRKKRCVNQDIYDRQIKAQ